MKQLQIKCIATFSLLSCLLPRLASAEIDLTQIPLFLTNTGTPNILMMLGNANSMDGNAAGAGVGSASPDSKSEIARNAMKTIINHNINKINMGLLAFQQNPADLWYLSTSASDVSYLPSDYDPDFEGPRNSQTKKFRMANPSNPGSYVYYNVASGLYSQSYSQSYFCHSSTACTSPSHDFRGTSQSGCTAFEDEVNGPWDTYQCYQDKVGAATNGLNGHKNFIGNFYFVPSTNSLAQGITDFGKHVAGFYVSRSWSDITAPGMGFLHVPLAFLDTAHAENLNYKLATSDPNIHTYAPTDPTRPLQNHGLQPLEGTILTANNYYNNNGLPADERSVPIGPIPESCNKNYLVMLTDGLPSVDKNGNPSADVTKNLNDVVKQAEDLLNSPAKVKSYIVGFAMPYGVNPEQLNIIAEAGGTNTAYYADDPESLDAAFAAIFQNIAAQVEGASASVTADSSSLQTSSSIFQAKFDGNGWTGDLVKLSLTNSGAVGNAIWKAAEKLDAKLPDSRAILTYKPSNNKGIPFRWPVSENSPSETELDTQQISALNKNSTDLVDHYGQARLEFLRGDSTNEGPNGLKFRARKSKLGDIVNSAPTFVGPPSKNIADPSYIAFKTAKANRKPVVYVGANDGMLHGFNANTGQELFGYVPAALYEHLPKLTARNYTHRYFVDSSPNVQDVYWGTSWKSILVSGMGHGAKGIFALNVTNPNTFKETKANNVVRFEFPKANTNSTQSAEVGYISGRIPIVKLNTGQYAAIFGNGYNACGSGKASLFIVNIQNGNVIKRISTGVGNPSSPNGLANPVAVDIDGNETVDYVYAGDLQGNLWKFNLSGASKGSWKRQYKLFAAGEPITQTPTVSKHPEGDYMVYFGTGKYMENSDINNVSPNKFYGIWDHFNSTVKHSNLITQTVTSTTNINGKSYRLVSQNTVDYTSNNPDKGWYLSLPLQGERSVSDAVLTGGKVIFNTLTPSFGTCSTGGNSWLMELDYLTGGMLGFQALDTNGDNLVDSTDTIVGGLGSSTINFTPAIVRAQPTSDGQGSNTSSVKEEYKYMNQSDGSVTKVTEGASGAKSRRSSWRQIILD